MPWSTDAGYFTWTERERNLGKFPLRRKLNLSFVGYVEEALQIMEAITEIGKTTPSIRSALIASV